MNKQNESAALAQYLTRFQPAASQVAHWPKAKLRVTAALTENLPPREFTLSVRAIMFRDRNVMVITDPNSIHLTPGGRCEPGESIDETLERELLEETGYKVRTRQLLGVMCFEHLTPRPDVCPPHLFPLFFQPVYHVEAGDCDESRRERDGFEISAEFRPLELARQWAQDPVTSLFLDRALALRSLAS